MLNKLQLCFTYLINNKTLFKFTGYAKNSLKLQKFIKNSLHA